MRGLPLVAVAGVAAAAAIMVARDPEEAWAVAVVVVALGAAAGAASTMLMLRDPRSDRRRRPASIGRAVAVRRGIEIAVAVMLLLWLRVVDGLSPITGSFVVGAFAVAEVVLSASARPSR